MKYQDLHQQPNKLSFYNCDTNVFVISRTQDTQFYGEYLDYNGSYTYGTRVSASNGYGAYTNIENYYQYPSGSIATIGNYVQGQGSDLNIAVATFDGANIGTSGGTAIQLASSASCDVTSTDISNWDYGFNVLNVGGPSSFNINGTVFRDNTTYDFYVQHPTTSGRFQGSGDHTKINNASNDFYWSFMDITDGEFDVTRKLSVTFDDGTHTDATTLIFNGSPMGVMQGGEITIVSGLTISTAAGFGYCQKASVADVYQRIDWNNSQLVLPANAESYLYINASGLIYSPTKPSDIENIIVGRVVTNNAGIEFIDQSSHNAAHTANLLSNFNREALGPVYANGSIVTENVVPKKLNVTAGSYYFSENNFTTSGTSSINLNQYFRSSSAWSRSTSSIVPTDLYNSGSGGILIPLSSSAYTKHTLYGVGEGVDEKYFLVIGQSQYDTLVEAEGAGLPTPPDYFDRGVVSIASIYVQSGSSNITQIEDIRPVIGFKSGGVNASSVHGNLLGLSADDHIQYLLVNGGRPMSGNLDMGTNNITNVGTVDGVTVSAHATRHQFGGLDPVGSTTPGPNYIPYADVSGTLNDWVSTASTTTFGKVIASSSSTTVVSDNDPRFLNSFTGGTYSCLLYTSDAADE